MSFDVEVTLSGICAFVPNADPRARDKMAVLLVNALPRRDDQGVEQEKRASDCTLLKPHFPVLIFNSENLTQTAGLPPTNAKVVWRLDRLEVRFKVESPTAFRLVGGDQTTLALEDRDVEGFDFGPRMADLSPALAQVHPDCFADGPASQELISARVMVEAGRLKTKDLDARFLFRFDLPDGGETPSEPYSDQAALVFRDIEGEFVILARHLDTGDELRLPLCAPEGGKVDLEIGNLCEIDAEVLHPERMLDFFQVSDPEDDEDFRWFYEICANRKAIRLVDGKLPIPKFAGRNPDGPPGGGNGIGAVDCLRCSFLPRKF